MKLLTKDWYQTMQDSRLGFQLEVDERAVEKSEELYQTIRAEKLRKWLLEQQEVCEITEEVYDPEEARRNFGEYLDRELEYYQTRTPVKILQKVADLRVLHRGGGLRNPRPSLAGQ